MSNRSTATRYEVILMRLEHLEAVIAGPEYGWGGGSDWEWLYCESMDIQRDILVRPRRQPDWNGIIGPGSRQPAAPPSPLHELWDPIRSRAVTCEHNILEAVRAVTSWRIPDNRAAEQSGRSRGIVQSAGTTSHS